MISICTQCPRACGVDRSRSVGYCGAPAAFRIARADLHPWEEPPISGTRGSGTVFFSGCNLRCAYCQNREVSREGLGREVDESRLTELLFTLRDRGAHNINLVTPTPYALRLAVTLARIKPTLGIPIVYNCGGYESVDTLRRLEGVVDVYLPDVKYFSSELAQRYSDAPDYFPTAMAALAEMLRQTGEPRFDADGILQRGTIVRHLVLPSHRTDSINLLRALAERFGTSTFRLSLMSQYTPAFALDTPFKELHRKLTSFEYDNVLNTALALGFDGYFQSRSSASSAFTPDFRASVKNV